MAAIGTLTIEMAANVARLQRDMDRARGTVDGAMNRIRSSVQLATRALGALGGALSIKAIVDQADAMNLLNSRLKLVTSSQQDLIKTQAALVNIANRTYTSISGTVDLYTALARSTKDLNVSQGQLLTVVETFNKAIIISGGSVQSAQAAITQFNQAMASGVLRGEEFNSISEQAPMIMEMLSQSLGVTRGALRDMAKEGLLTADVVLAALQEGAGGVSKQFDQMDKTVGQATNQLTQSLSLLIAEMDKATGSTSLLAKGLDLITLSMNKFREAIAIGAARPEIFNWLEGTFAKLPEQIQESAAETARLTRQMNEAMKGTDEAAKGQARAILAAREEEEKRKKAAEELLKTYEKLTETLRGDIIKGTAALQAEQQGLNKAQEEFLALVSSSEWKQYTTAQKMLITNLYEQKIAIEQAKEAELKRQKEIVEAERQREKEKVDNQKRLMKMLDEETEARREWIAEDKKAEDQRIKAQEKLYAEHRKQIESINEQLTDALMRAFESGKGFGKAFKDTIVNMFKTMVLRPILAPIVAGMTGSLGLPATAGELGGAGGTLNVLTSIKSTYEMISGGFAALGNSVAFAADSLGAWLVNNTTGVLNKMGGSLMQSAGTLGTAASYLGGAAAGIALGTVISGGYSAIGRSGNTATIAGTAIGAVLGGPIGAAIGGAIGGLVNRAFGRKAPQTTATGIMGTFSTEGATVGQYEEWVSKGGWFRSDKSGVNYTSVSSELDQFLDFSLIQITQATRAYAKTLGLNADAVNGITQSIKINMQGLNKEQQQQKIMEALGGFADLLASQFGLTSETMANFANSLFTVNQVFGTLNQRLLETSLAAGQAASQLIELFGSVENFAQATSIYYQNFYTEAERTAKSTQQLTDVLASMGFTLPATRNQFRALVEVQDLMTTAGRQNYAALINLSQIFDEITPKLDTLAGKFGSLIGGMIDDVLSEIDQQIQTTQNAANQARNAAQQYAAAGKALRDASESLLVGSQNTAIRQRYQAAINAARGGDIEAMRVLPGLASQLQAFEQSSAVSSVQAATMSARISSELLQIATLSDALKSGSDYQAMLYDVNIAALQATKELLLSGNATVDAIKAQTDVLTKVGEMIVASQELSTNTYVDESGKIRTTLVSGNGIVIKSLDDNSVLQIQALADSVDLQSLQFSNSITGQTTTFTKLSEDQVKGLNGIKNETGEVVSLTDLVAQATSSNTQLSDSILQQLRTPDAGSEFLARVLSAGNDFIAGRLDGVIAAINQQTTAQQSEIARQQNLQKAQADLETLAEKRDAAYRQTMSWAPSMPFASKEYFRIENTPNDPLFRQLFREYEQRFLQTQGFSWNANWGGGDAARIQQLDMIREEWKKITWERQRSAFEDPLEAQREVIRALGGVPAFALGGMHSGGLRLVGERGPELEMTGPARYMSNANLAAMMNNGSGEEIRQLREENKVQMRAIVSLQSRMTRLFERWDTDGLPEERAVA